MATKAERAKKRIEDAIDKFTVKGEEYLDSLDKVIKIILTECDDVVEIESRKAAEDSLRKKGDYINRMICEMLINRYVKSIIEKFYTEDSLYDKKQIVRMIKDGLMYPEYAIAHPERGTPCNIYANASPDKKGRYILEEIGTKKRSHSSETIFSYFPIKLVPKK